jgi:hypothetical protein
METSYQKWRKQNEVTVYGMQALRGTREDDMLGIALRRMSGSS